MILSEKVLNKNDVINNTMDLLFGLLDEAIDDMENGRVQTCFPVCISKVILSPNVPKLDISDRMKEYFTDTDWKNEKDKMYEKNNS